MKNKNMTMEQPKIKPEVKKEKLPHEIELEQRPQPLKGESFNKWLERIGGPNVKVVEALEKYPLAKKKKDRPLLIDETGDFIVNNENIGTYFDKAKIDQRLKEGGSDVLFKAKQGEYQIKKELFYNPSGYCLVIKGELEKNKKIVADKEFGKSVEKWDRDSINEQIAQKEKELKQAEEEQALYKPIGWFYKKPVVKDLGYYANQSRVEELRKEIDELKKKPIVGPEIKQEEKPKEEKKPAASQGKQAGSPKSEGFGGEEKPKKEKPVKEDGWIYKLGKKIREQKPREFFKKVIDKTKQGIDFADEEGIKIKKGLSKIKKERIVSKPATKERAIMEKRLAEIDKNLKNIPQKVRGNRILNQTLLSLTKERMELKKRLKKLTKK